MTNAQIIEKLRAAPFRPFVIRTADGREYRVGHPEMVAILPNSRTCGVMTDSLVLATLDIRLITALREIEAEGGSGGARESA